MCAHGISDETEQKYFANVCVIRTLAGDSCVHKEFLIKWSKNTLLMCVS